jgi:hypothetical protein
MALTDPANSEIDPAEEEYGLVVRFNQFERIW